MKRLLLAAAACLALAACTTATPYQPYQPGGMSSSAGGFSEQRIGADRFRITFSGNSLTSRETVERYLLFRSAEVTLAEGYDWFSLADRHTDRKTRTIIDRHDPFGYDYWRPTWAYLGYGRWVVLDPWGPRSFFDDAEVRRIDRYEASAEIFLGKGAKPAGDPSAFDAREVVKNLGPTIVRPAS
jgi:hypothetical protein